MRVHKYNEMMRYLTRPKDTLSKSAKAAVVKDFYKKAELPKSKPPIIRYIDSINRMYSSDGGNAEDPGYIDPKEMEDIKKTLPVSEMVKEERFNDKILKRDKYEPKKVAGIKESSLYKLLQDPKVLGVELGHDTILQIMNLIQGSGIVKKPEKSTKVAVVEKPKEAIDHIALLSNGDEFV